MILELQSYTMPYELKKTNVRELSELISLLLRLEGPEDGRNLNIPGTSILWVARIAGAIQGNATGSIRLGLLQIGAA